MLRPSVWLMLLLAYCWAVPASAAPINTVSVYGKEWLQPLDFVNLSWNDINSTCDANTGACIGTLGAIDVTGYTWAGLGDVNGLFNAYLAAAGMLPESLLDGPDVYAHSGSVSSWAPAFLSDFQHTRLTRDRTGFNLAVDGVTRDRGADVDKARAGVLWNYNSGSSDRDRVTTNTLLGVGTAQAEVGAWFFRAERSPSPEVPAPSTMFLLGLALLGLHASRFRAV